MYIHAPHAVRYVHCLYTLELSQHQRVQTFDAEKCPKRAGFKMHTKFILAPSKNIHNTYNS